MNLWIINIQLESIQAPIQLIFNDADRAVAADASLHAAMRAVRDRIDAALATRIVDDYGRTLTVDPAEIAAVLFSDYARELNARQEIGILEAHAQIDAQRRASQDEKLQRHGQLVRANAAPGPMGPLPFMPGRN